MIENTVRILIGSVCVHWGKLVTLSTGNIVKDMVIVSF